MYDWLCNSKNGNWLLILDNAEDACTLPEVGNVSQGPQHAWLQGKGSQTLSAYLPRSENGRIIVTTRSRDVALKLVEMREIIEVEQMAKSQAAFLLRKKLEVPYEEGDILELAATLEFMPLAMVQAAAYISRRVPRCSVQQYLEAFRESDREKTSLLNLEGGHLRRDWEANNSIIVTWQISFEHICSIRSSAASLLSLMSFFDRQGIPETLLRNEVGEASDMHYQHQGESLADRASDSGTDACFEKDVQILRDFSFISIDSFQSFEMHALVQLAMQTWLASKRQLEGYKQQYITKLSAQFPIGKSENWTRCQSLFPHAKLAIKQQPIANHSLKEWASLLDNAAQYASNQGDLANSLEISEIVAEVRKKLLGEESDETIDSILLLSKSLYHTGQYDKAHVLLIQVLETLERKFEADAGGTIGIMILLAQTYYKGGRWKEAEKLLVQVLEKCRKVFGVKPHDTLDTTDKLAAASKEIGGSDEDLKLTQEYLHLRNLVLGAKNPDTLHKISHLAAMHSKQDRLNEAEKLQMQVVEKRKKVIGTEHPYTLVAMYDLAGFWRAQGRDKELMKLMQECAHLSERMLGAEHPQTLERMTVLATLYFEQDRLDEAEKLFELVVEKRKKVVGAEHRDTLAVMRHLACTWSRQGRKEEAVKLMHGCIRLRNRVFDVDHPDTMESLQWVKMWQKE